MKTATSPGSGGGPLPIDLAMDFYGYPDLEINEIDDLCEQINTGGVPPESLTGEFDVNVFAVVRVKVPGIKAESMEKASEMAKDEVIINYLSRLTGPDPYTVEFADEFSRTVVDVVGDDDYSQSREFTD